MNITAIVRNKIRCNLGYIKWRLRRSGENVESYITQKNHTNICIEGYGRSANSFAVRMFRLANPKANVSHHTHSIGNIAEAIKFNIPAVALIRAPADAIVSAVIASPKHDVDDKILQYITFYQWVKKYKEKIVVVDFVTVLNDFNFLINQVNQAYSTDFNLIDDLALADEQVKKDVDKRYEKFGDKASLHNKPLPSDDRKKVKDRLAPKVLSHPKFSIAQKLYDELTRV